jgi:O-antigen/teichoic acid export membrane protein
VKHVISQSSDLLQNVLVTGGYSLAAILFLFLFHLLLARYLGPDLYSVIGTFSSILLTVILMASSIYYVITRFITYHHTRYQYEQINYLVREGLKLFFALGFLIFLILFIFSEQIARFLNIPNPAPVVVFGFAVWLQLLVPVYEGAFKGLENLHAMGRMRLVEAISRWLIALLFAYFLAFQGSDVYKVTAMVFALGFGTFIALTYSYVYLKKLQLLDAVRPNMQEIWDYARPAAITTISIALLLNLDVILVKHFYSPEQAGVYAAASLLSKIPFLFSWVFSSVIFPRVTALYVNGRPSGHLLRISLKWMSGIMILSTFVMLFFANSIFSAVFGSQYKSVGYLGLYAFAMGLLAIVNVLTVYQLALKRFTLAKIIPWFLGAEVVLFYFFHQSIFEIVFVVVFVTSLLVASTLYALRGELHLEYLFNE